MSELLRAALSADEDTPAGVDLPAVRARAGRLRRTRHAVAGTAVLAALAVLVPVAAVQRDRAAPTAGGTAGAPDLVCPAVAPTAPANPRDSRVPGDLLPPAPVTGAVVCAYTTSVEPAGGRLAGSARLGAAEAGPLAIRLAAAPPLVEQACTSDLGPVLALRFAGPGWDETLRVELYGCDLVSNGEVTRTAGVDGAMLRELAERAAR